MSEPEFLYSRIWKEEPEPADPFLARVCRCAGYDVYGEIIKKASWIEYLFLLFRGERPSKVQSALLESLAVALANPGPRDPSVQAATSAGVGGSTMASRVMAAAAVGAGQLGGAHEVFHAMTGWVKYGQSLESWAESLNQAAGEFPVDIWPDMEHPPGFDPNASCCPTPVLQTLDRLVELAPDSNLAWLQLHRGEMESISGVPLSMTGVTAACLYYLEFTPSQGEALTLLFRLPGALAHSLEAEQDGLSRYPFHHGKLILDDDPGPKKT
ncbi:MAG: citryl-CoA lyase [Gammaproteobacteria bacterium]|nr:citryl-CoA lyase [Gammaproteobacteria bacterium]